MINGVKVSLVYHLYCKNVKDIQAGTGNVYNEINRRCLEHFHDVFDDAVFCVCVDDKTDSELIQKAVEWIWSCGFKDNVTIKVKPNSPYRDSQTFYDEVVDHLSDFDGMVFFGHNKGNTCGDALGLRQWIVFSYYSCLDEIEAKIKRLADHTIVYGYLPLVGGVPPFEVFNKYGWMIPGAFFLFNPEKILGYLDKTGEKLPPLEDRYSAENFFAKIIDIRKNEYGFVASISFEDYDNTYFDSGVIDYYHVDHYELLGYFLPEWRIDQYRAFYDKIVDGL